MDLKADVDAELEQFAVDAGAPRSGLARLIRRIRGAVPDGLVGGEEPKLTRALPPQDLYTFSTFRSFEHAQASIHAIEGPSFLDAGRSRRR